uniref:Uncharacterized protein n=1 Tax=Anguilla anguilla TaxID=7936 RepID=A0A0E9XCU3_ANGAN
MPLLYLPECTRPRLRLSVVQFIFVHP